MFLITRDSILFRQAQHKKLSTIACSVAANFSVTMPFDYICGRKGREEVKASVGKETKASIFPLPLLGIWIDETGGWGTKETVRNFPFLLTE